MVLPGALTNYLSLVEYRKLNKAPKRENRKLHKCAHIRPQRVLSISSQHCTAGARTTVLISPSGELYQGSWGAMAARCSKPRVHVRSGGAWGTPGTPTSLREHRAHYVRMCAPEHTSARCAHVCSFQGITTHGKPVVPLRSVDVRVLRPVYLLCSNTSADISYKSTFF